MITKDLMLGDWVHLIADGSNEYLQVSYVRKDGVGFEQYNHFFDEIEAIRLTEEILKVNGFKESSIECGCYYFPEKYQELNDRGFAVETDDEGRFWITDHQLMMTRYVHKFQHCLRLCGLNNLADDFKIE